jgi:hypothetical protein
VYKDIHFGRSSKTGDDIVMIWIVRPAAMRRGLYTEFIEQREKIFWQGRLRFGCIGRLQPHRRERQIPF